MPNKISDILLDQDGVIANFHLEAIRAHMREGRRFPQIPHHGPPLDLDYQSLLNLWPMGLSLQKAFFPDMKWDKGTFKQPQFWGPIDRDPFFWRNIPALAWWKEVVELCHQYARNVVIVSSPSDHPNSFQGKRQWLIKMGLGELDFHFCRQKWRLAHPNTLLIDDYEHNVNTFINPPDKRPGGKAILFPGPWNTNHAHSHNPLSYLKGTLEDLNG